jgi:hypothetical protein
VRIAARAIAAASEIRDTSALKATLYGVIARFPQSLLPRRAGSASGSEDPL